MNEAIVTEYLEIMSRIDALVETMLDLDEDTQYRFKAELTSIFCGSIKNLTD